MNWNEQTDEVFRRFAADFFERNCPPALRYFKHRQPIAVTRPWYEILGAQGWLAPAWPAEFGGMGLSIPKQLIYIEEYERLGMPRLPDQSLMNLGPVLIARGTAAQRDKYLPRILSGQHIWCQGYSEPGAGSDLASLGTSAVLDGDHYVINGHKIWTSVAYDANHMFALVRTDRSGKKQEGITFIMFSMDQPGVIVKPIKDISGASEFCEVFLTDVRAHVSDVVGAVGSGWDVAKALLGFERVWSGSPRQSQIALSVVLQQARRMKAADLRLFEDRIASAQMDVLDLGSLYQKTVRGISAGKSFGAEASVLKVLATETCQRITELLLDMSACAGMIFEGTDFDVTTSFLQARGPTIYGGSSQIQRNILSRQVLQLPNYA